MGESTPNSFLFSYTHTHTHTRGCTHTRYTHGYIVGIGGTHAITHRYVRTPEGRNTHTHTHRPVYSQTDSVNVAVCCVPSEVTVFESSAGFEWLLFFLFRVCGLR